MSNLEQDKPKKPQQPTPALAFKFGTPSEIYTTILKEVDALFSKFTAAGHDSEQTKEAKQKCHEQLVLIQNKIKQRIIEHKNEAEWDKFTIAFYGETNAGKSTIIETLRIHLAEESKKAEQEAFIAAMAKAGLSKAAFEAAQRATEATSQRLSVFEADFAARTSSNKSELSKLELELSTQHESPRVF
ncbi:hypothetical protein GCM10028811_08820 [Uliginosibacterium sediminicola]